MAQDRSKWRRPEKCAVSCRHTEIRANFGRFVHQQMRKWAALVTVRFIKPSAAKNAIYVLNENI
jgi:hypothetical protein